MAFVLCYHLIVPLLLCTWVALAYASKDPASIHFIGLLISRYYRHAIGFVFYTRYQPAKPPKPPQKQTLFPQDVTCIIPTVYDKEIYISDLGECLRTCLLNSFAEIFIVTDLETTRKRIEKIKRQVLDELRHNEPFKRSSVTVHTKVCSASNKREQLVMGIKAAKTQLLLLLDDHVFLKPQFLDEILPVFEDPLIGLCGTKKAVRRRALKATSFWGKYWERYWNFLGSTYIEQNDFRARCTNTADGGVTVVSGRAVVVRSSIVQDPKFILEYLHEMFFFGLFGPLMPDDDNFLTRWVTKQKKGWKIKIQDTWGATVETTLGQPRKFIGQCIRWSRTTYRSTLCSLLTDRAVWRRQPLTVWLAHIPSLFNLAFPWDIGIVYTFGQSHWYSRKRMLFLCIFIFFSKSIKNKEHFRQYPSDFFRYFFPLPAYQMFSWFHSLIKLYAACTFYNTSWTGREVNNPSEISFAFAFDVDGVLLKGKTPIPGVQKTIGMLHDQNIPFILFTNGGGKMEEAHVAIISSRLGVELSADQFIQSHTPYRDLVPLYGDKNILVIGGANGEVRDIAESYGFNNVFTTSDDWLAFKSRHPFPEFTQLKHQEIAQEPKAVLLRNGAKIQAILVWSSPRDWCFDLQILCDYCSRNTGLAIFFAHSDSVWATEHEEPRLALGAFISAFEGVWKESMKGQPVPKYTVLGKPTQRAFEFGEKVLRGYRKQLNKTHGTNNRIKTVYMIGDNPESDIQGANKYRSPYGTKWKGLLVETGVYKPGTIPAHLPINTSRTYNDAVQWALGKEKHAIED